MSNGHTGNTAHQTPYQGNTVLRSDQPDPAIKIANLISQKNQPVHFSFLAFEDQNILIQEVEAAILFFIEAGSPVYLDGFGIIFPKICATQRAHNLRDKYIVHTETYRTLNFEKCYDLIHFHRERFQGIIETKEIVQRVHTKSAPFVEATLSIKSLNTCIKELFQKLRTEVVSSGRSAIFAGLGEFFALHNRQGETVGDWYAGADIFLNPKYTKTIKSSKPTIYDRPVLDDSFETFSSIYGADVADIQIPLREELKALGYEIGEDTPESVIPATINIRGYNNSSNELSSSSTIISFVSNNLRQIGIERAKNKQKGTEFVVQTAVAKSSFDSKTGKLNAEALPSWIKRFFVTGWILLQSSKTGRARSGAGISLGIPLTAGGEQSFHTLCAVPYKKILGDQLAQDGAFEYMSLIPIMEDEAAVGAQYSTKLLFTLLERKEHDQIVKPQRPSVVAKTSFISR